MPLLLKCYQTFFTRQNKTSNWSRTQIQKQMSYCEDAAASAIEGDTVHWWQVSQNSLVHLHMLVNSCRHQLTQPIRAIQPPTVYCLHWSMQVFKKHHEKIHFTRKNVGLLTSGCELMFLVEYINSRTNEKCTYQYWVGFRRWLAARVACHNAGLQGQTLSIPRAYNLPTNTWDGH